MRIGKMLLVTLAIVSFETRAEPPAAAVTVKVTTADLQGLWRELGTSMTVDGEMDPSNEFWIFKPDGTLATKGTAMVGGAQPYTLKDAVIDSESVGGAYTVVSLKGDRMILRGPYGGFWHLEHRHFDPAGEKSGRYYDRKLVAAVMAEGVCVRMSNNQATDEVRDQKLKTRLETLGIKELDKEKLKTSSEYYADDPAFVDTQAVALNDVMRKCMPSKI